MGPLIFHGYSRLSSTENFLPEFPEEWLNWRMKPLKYERCSFFHKYLNKTIFLSL